MGYMTGKIVLGIDLVNISAWMAIQVRKQKNAHVSFHAGMESEVIDDSC